MADYEKDLGTIFSLLQKILDEIEDIQSRLPKDRIPTSDLPNLIWFDTLPPYMDMRKGIALPQKNSAERRNNVVSGNSEVIHLFDESGYNYELKSLDKDWDDRYCKRNNLYFVEITQVHMGLDRFFEFISPQALQLCREGKLAFVWWFPHEGFHFEGLRESVRGKINDAGWFERLCDQFVDYDIHVGQHYFVSGDLRIEDNWKDWIKEHPDYEHLFKKAIGIDFFHHHYFLQYVDRTQLKFDADTTTFPIEDYETYGYLPSAKVRNVYLEPDEIVDSKRGTARGTHPRRQLKPEEILTGIPTPEEKTRDLICFNGRIRPHRSVMVSELFRLGYNNDNSHISWIERNMDPKVNWRTRCFRELDDVEGKEQWVNSKNAWGELMSTQHQKDYFFDFWEQNTGTIISDSSTDEVDVDDRIMPVDMFKESFFFLITETLFGNNDENCLQITEKTYKALAYRIPFIIVGGYGTLDYIRSLGYQTFPHMFNESYDEIKDPAERMSAIVYELEKWKVRSLEQKREMYGKSINSLKHNYYHFKNSSPNRMNSVKRMFDRLQLHD